ncbi:hypothetical protein RFI_19583, partial [Reticulomyxa filosa]
QQQQQQQQQQQRYHPLHPHHQSPPLHRSPPPSQQRQHSSIDTMSQANEVEPEHTQSESAQAEGEEDKKETDENNPNDLSIGKRGPQHHVTASKAGMRGHEKERKKDADGTLHIVAKEDLFHHDKLKKNIRQHDKKNSQ